MIKKAKIVIWGAGEKLEEVYNALDYNKCKLLYIVDRDTEKQGVLWDDKYIIANPNIINANKIDSFIISARNTESIIKYALELGIPKTKLISFWENNAIIDYLKKEYILERENALLRMRLKNAPFEYGEPFIHFMRNKDLFRELKNNRKCLSRFGDGEFEIIRGKKRGWFQQNNSVLARRLEQILTDKQDRIIIGIADNFGNLDKYTDVAADGIREYVTGDVREDIYKLLSPKRLYADAYITRSYIMYKDKMYIKGISESFKSLWDGRKVVIVENMFSRFGVNNDLLAGTVGIRRIICPNKNAFDHYSNILDAVLENVNREEVVLVSLGQTATVLSYDLGMKGYQAIDIGQFDTEYEWYLSGATDRIEIPEKAVAELSWWHEPNQKINEEYNRQIICTIGN